MTSILNLPLPDKATNPAQKSVNVNEMFLTRFMPPWARPASLPAYVWRQWVLNQPVAIVCRETLVANLLALDWKITPINSKYKEELEPTIKYYTRLFKRGGDYPALGLDYSGLVEWIAADILDTPFGGAAEIGRKGRAENGRVQWIRPLDAGTLYPTLNQDFPIVQYWQGTDVVVFKPWEISRSYMSPHSYIWREGWGMAPPEKVYFALDLLNRGDKYYANLLLDIPSAGVLDLGNVERSFAEEWVESFKTFVNDNTTSFKIPVLYEHENPVEFISFGKEPNNIMFDHITLKYAAMVAASYGMSLSDIGMQTTSASGETLAGSIRQERRTRKTGFARIKAKVKTFFDQILPDTLEFNFIDYDDELNVALGKARLASSQSFKTVKEMGIFSKQEIRSQWIQDGLMSISLPDEIPPDAEEMEQNTDPFGKKKIGGNAEPEMIGDNKAPSAGGEGEVKSLVVKSTTRSFDTVIETLVQTLTPRILDSLQNFGEDNLEIARSLVSESLFDDEDAFGLQELIGSLMGSKSLVSFKLDGIEDEFRAALGAGFEEVPLAPYIRRLEGNIRKSLNGFLGRTAAFLLNGVLTENQFAASEDVNYNLIVNLVQNRIERSLTDFVSIHVNDEAQKVLQHIREEN